MFKSWASSIDLRESSSHNGEEMQKSEKFFIFSWKELLVITLLVMTLVGFFFTLGLHYGKKLHAGVIPTEAPVAKLEESPENVPSKESLDKGGAAVEPAAQDALKTATETAIAESGLKVDHVRPVDLPEEKGASGRTLDNSTQSASNDAKFAVQLGSYTSKREAQQKINVLTKRGLKPEIRTAEVNHETRYRVVLTGFKTRALADLRGRELKLKRKVENFVVIKSE